MTLIRAAALPAFLITLFLLPHRAVAQALPTATQTAHLSAFAGGTGVYTNIEGGRNLSITAGADLSISSFRGYHPSIEIRGTYPVHNGAVDAQKSALAGIRIDRQFGNFRPYVDFLIGRGEIDYQNGGFISGPITYISSTTNVFSPGGGVDYDFTDHLSLKVDLQYQFWKVPGEPAPIVPSGNIHPTVGTLGVVYRFGDSHPSHHAPPPPPAAPQPPPTQP
jgi:opacity protein-like surface antigen